MSKEFSDLNSIYVQKNLFAMNHSYSMKMFFQRITYDKREMGV